MLKRLIALSVVCFIASVATGLAPSAFAQQTERSKWPPLSEAALNRVPTDLRDIARKYIRYPENYQREFQNLGEEARREAILKSLLYNVPQAAEFILDKLPKESASIRSMILGRIILRDHFRSNPRVYRVLETMIVTDPDLKIVSESLEALRRLRMQGVRELLARRLAAASRSDDRAAVKILAAEEERWISLERGTMLPSFLRLVPPQFSIRTAGDSVRFVAFGDFGTGRDSQKQTAAAMLRYHQAKLFDFGITLGDNFYPNGMYSTDDPRWKTQWEALYGPMRIKFYATLGNHDWHHPDSPAAQILYSEESQTWRMPAPYYTFTAGCVQFFALDTNDISEAQLTWLGDELEKSKATWKVVYGHHPIFYVSNTSEIDARVEVALLPVLKGQADVYFAGHSHNLQHLRSEGGVEFFIAGGGGATRYEIREAPQALFVKSVYGFAAVEAGKRDLTVSFIGADSTRLYDYTIRK